MKFYFSPEVVSEYFFEAEQTVEIVESRMKQGFIPWLLNVFKRHYKIERQFDLPILFVTDEDLGRNMDEICWHLQEKTRRFNAIDEHEMCQIPAEGRIPSPSNFDYRHYEFSLENEFNASEQPIVVERVGSFDWLGIYCGFNSPYRRIFIRIDKILEEPCLKDSFGVASVVLHELGHALMDTKSTVLKFETPVSQKNGNTLDFYMEEAMANLFAYRAIRGRNFKRGSAVGIAWFMMRQPAPYALGVKMGMAKTTRYSSLDFIIKSYIRNWYLAKCDHHHMAIKDLAAWVKLISTPSFFTDNDLKDQIHTLFTV